MISLDLFCAALADGDKRSTELTFGDADNFGIVCSVDQELGFSVGQFVQPDICCLFINKQPVVNVM